MTISESEGMVIWNSGKLFHFLESEKSFSRFMWAIGLRSSPYPLVSLRGGKPFFQTSPSRRFSSFPRSIKSTLVHLHFLNRFRYRANLVFHFTSITKLFVFCQIRIITIVQPFVYWCLNRQHYGLRVLFFRPFVCPSVRNSKAKRCEKHRIDVNVS